MSSLFALYITIGLIFFGILLSAQARRRREWKQTPALNEYLAAHPSCRTSRGIRCSGCGASSMRNWGLESREDPCRLISCNQCGQKLYRIEK